LCFKDDFSVLHIASHVDPLLMTGHRDELWLNGWMD